MRAHGFSFTSHIGVEPAAENPPPAPFHPWMHSHNAKIGPSPRLPQYNTEVVARPTYDTYLNTFKMWLINTITLKLKFFTPPRVPSYAILSHTWGDEEVSFQEFQDLDKAMLKAGFAKIQKTCQLARNSRS